MEYIKYKGKKIFEVNHIHLANKLLAEMYFERQLKNPIDNNIIRRFTKIIAEYPIDITLFYIENNGKIDEMKGKGIGKSIKYDLVKILNNIKESEDGNEESDFAA